MKHIIFVTGNQGKLAELRSILGSEIQSADIDLPELQTTSVQEVIELKAREAYKQLQQPVVVEDTGLYFEAWNGLPGALIRWFLKSVGNEGLCQMLTNFENRAAYAESWLGYFDGENFQAFSGRIDGTIAREPQGELGFGWDFIFIPQGSELTFAQLGQEEKNKISMRKLAAEKLRSYLKL